MSDEQDEKKMLRTIIIVLVCIFYIAPLYTLFVSNENYLAYLDRVIVFILFPIFCFVSSIIYTKTFGFKWYLCVIVGLLSLPSIIIYYGSSYWAYAFVYLLLSLAGCGTGVIAVKRGQ